MITLRLGLLSALAATVAVPAGTAAETLEEALVAAYQNNPRLLATRAELRATDEQVPLALSNWRPQVSVSGDVGKAEVESEAAFFTAEESRTPRSIALELNQPLYRGGRTTAETSRAENRVEAGRARLTTVEQSVLLDGATAYMDVLRDQSVLDLSINNEQVLRRQLRATRDRFEVGDTTRTDVAQAEARVSRAVADRVSARGDLESSRAIYRQVIGTLPGELEWPEPVPGLPESKDGAIALAIEGAPEVVTAQFTERAARDDIDLVFGELLPTLSLNAEVSRADDTSADDSLRESASFAAQLTVPLYQAGAVSARVRAAKQTAAQRRRDVDDARRTAVEGATQAWEDRQTARARIEAFEDEVRAAEVALEAIQQEAAVGLRTTLDVLDTEQDLFEAQVDLVRAERDEFVAAFQLRSAIGTMTAAALELPVELYDPREHYEAVRNKLFGLGDE